MPWYSHTGLIGTPLKEALLLVPEGHIATGFVLSRINSACTRILYLLHEGTRW